MSALNSTWCMILGVAQTGVHRSRRPVCTFVLAKTAVLPAMKVSISRLAAGLAA